MSPSDGSKCSSAHGEPHLSASYLTLWSESALRAQASDHPDLYSSLHFHLHPFWHHLSCQLYHPSSGLQIYKQHPETQKRVRAGI